MLGLPLIRPDWDLPYGVKVAITTRDGGVSEGKYGNFNLSHAVGDMEDALGENRMRLQNSLGERTRIAWISQIHSNTVIDGKKAVGQDPHAEADGTWTDEKGIACVVLTADCVPVLLASNDGSKVAAVHAGWRGLAAGILREAASIFGGEEYSAYIGPCICQAMYPVGKEVWDELRMAGATEEMSHRGEGGKYHVSLPKLAKKQLRDCKAQRIYHEDRCTFLDKKNFFSARRDGEKSGRFATLIWRSLD